MNNHENPNQLLVFGWREWITLPDLGLPPIKAKVDTGARTCALHAFKIRPYLEKDLQKIEFYMHPIQHNTDVEIICTAHVVDKREVTDSGGHKEERWVIQTPITVGQHSWPIETTLTAETICVSECCWGVAP